MARPSDWLSYSSRHGWQYSWDAWKALKDVADGRSPAPDAAVNTAYFALTVISRDQRRRRKTLGRIYSLGELARDVGWTLRRGYRMHARLKRAGSASEVLAYSGGRPREYSLDALAKVDKVLRDRKRGKRDITTREIQFETGVSLWTIRRRRTELKLGLSRHQDRARRRQAAVERWNMLSAKQRQAILLREARQRGWSGTGVDPRFIGGGVIRIG